MTTRETTAGGGDDAGSAGDRARCLKCDNDLGQPSRGVAGVPVCGRSICAAFGARCDAVLAGLARLPGWASVIEVTRALDTATSTSSAYHSLRHLQRAELVASQAPPPGQRHTSGGRTPHVYRLTPSGRALAATIPDSAPPTPAAPAKPAAPAGVRPARARPAIVYLSSARLSVPEQRRVARVLAQWTRERGFDLVDVVTETRPGARDGFDQLVAAVAGCNIPTVVVPSYGHLAVDARRQAAMVDDLEDVGGVVVAMDDLGERGDRG